MTWEDRIPHRLNDYRVAERFGWKITRETIYYECDTRQHDCATYPGDKVYGGNKDAWVIRYLGERRGWCYAQNEDEKSPEGDNFQVACAVLLDYVEMANYTTDVDAALQFAFQIGLVIRPDLMRKKWVVAKMLSVSLTNAVQCVSSKSEGAYWEVDFDKLALCICEAWLESE